jgi:AP-1 complex subunit beta-1
MSDGKYFSSTKKGEIPELRAALNSLKESVKKDAVKKVVALMTVGKDMGKLFTDVLKCITTTNLELKKLVYLYIMNYARNNEEFAILAVNTFQKDCKDPNPLVRALALRTMGCLRVPKIMEYLCDPLALCLEDNHPYVAKTAALCVAKLYDMDPDLVESRGFLGNLRELLADTNPTVVANAVAALVEIDEISPEPVFKLNRSNLSKLVTAVEEATEWGQVYILSSLVRYQPKGGKEAKLIIEKIIPQIQHSNSAVVLAVVKILMKYFDKLEDREFAKMVKRKMKPPLVTLLNKQPEIRYVALRNISLILQKHPSLLKDQVHAFFCKFNDPTYVKIEKLEIMIMLATEKNIDQILLELKGYAINVDIEFVRKAIRCMGRAAIKLEKSSDKCVHVLLDLIKDARANHVPEECIIVLSDIFRRYPNKYDSIIPSLIEQRDLLEEPEAVSALIWIVGEYYEKLEEPESIIEEYIETFRDDPTQVQLQLLTAVVKLFLKDPQNQSFKVMLEKVLTMATKEVSNPDCRDRGWLYWRLLNEAPQYAKQVVLSSNPITDMTKTLDSSVLNHLLDNMSTLASVYHKPVSFLLPSIKKSYDIWSSKFTESKPKIKEGRGQSTEDLSDSSTSTRDSETTHKPPTQDENVMDLLGLGTLSTSTVGTTLESSPSSSLGGDTLAHTSPSMKRLVNPTDRFADGLQVDGFFTVDEDSNPTFVLTFTNTTEQDISGFQLKFNKNTYKIQAGKVNLVSVAPGSSQTVRLLCKFDPNFPSPPQPTDQIVVALKSSLVRSNKEVPIFRAPCPIHHLLRHDGKLSKSEYRDAWKSLKNEHGGPPLNVPTSLSIPLINQKLEANNIFFVIQKPNPNDGVEYLFFSCKLDSVMLCEIGVGPTGVVLVVKAQNEHYAPLIRQSVEQILNH